MSGGTDGSQGWVGAGSRRAARASVASSSPDPRRPPARRPVRPWRDLQRGITPQAEQTWETGVIRGVVDGDTVIVDVQTATDPGFIAPADPATRTVVLLRQRINADGSHARRRRPRRLPRPAQRHPGPGEGRRLRRLGPRAVPGQRCHRCPARRSCPPGPRCSCARSACARSRTTTPAAGWRARCTTRTRPGTVGRRRAGGAGRGSRHVVPAQRRRHREAGVRPQPGVPAARG